MTTPKTLEQMAEEYARLEYERWLDSPALDAGTAMHNQIARFYLAGAQAALRLPEVLKLRELASDYSAESCSPNCGECWPCDFEKALARMCEMIQVTNLICWLCGYDGPPDGHAKCSPEPPQGPREWRMCIDEMGYIRIGLPCAPVAKGETILVIEKSAFERVVQERDELAITAARLFSDAGRLTEERDRLRAALNFTSADYEAPCTAGNPADSDCATTREESR